MAAFRILFSDASSIGISAVKLPSDITITLSETASISGNSDETMIIAIPTLDSSRIN